MSTTTPNGTLIHQEFDPMSRTVRRTVEGAMSWSDEQLFEYDGLGRMTLAMDNNGVEDVNDDAFTTWKYDSLGRVIEETTGGLVVSHAFTGIGEADNVTHPSGHWANTTFDVLGRADSVTDSVGLVQTYEYQGTGQLVERGLGNGNTITYDWDAHRLTGIQEAGPDAVAFSYGYDAMDRRISQTLAHAPSLAQEHVYDSLGRLTALTRPSATNMATAATWDLDAAHNWETYTATGIGATSEQRTHDATHSIEAIDHGSVEAYTHDANDNRLRDGTYTYEWDAFNRLRVVKGASDGALITEYDYDARDRRLTKALQTGIESFVYDGEDVVAEYLQGALVREYVHGPGYDEPLALLEDSNGDGSTSGPGDRRFFFVSDALGSIVQLEDGTGQAVQGYVYEAYGETRVLPASGDIDWTSLGGAPVVENPYGYTGQRLDPETGLYYYKARYYDPGDGRFLSRDPIGIWGDGGNLGNGYGYVGGMPTAATDPTGRQTMMQCPSLAHYCSYNATGDIAWVHEWQPAPVHDPCMSHMYWCMPGSEGDQHWAAYSDYVDDQIVETIAWAGCGSVGAVTMMEWESACSRNPCYGMNGWARLKCDLSQTASVATFAGGVGLAFKSTRTSFRAANYADDAASLGGGAKPGVDWAKQSRHVPGADGFVRGKSELLAPADELAPFLGKGRPVSSGKVFGEAGYRESIDFGVPIGIYRRGLGGPAEMTSVGTVHYSNAGYHVVPGRPTW